MSLFSQRRAFWLAVLLWLVAPGFLRLIAAAETDEVTFCSYNLKNWLLQKPLGGKEGAPLIEKPEKEKARVIVFLQQIQPDVLGVCEIGAEKEVAEFQARLKSVGIDLPHVEHHRGMDASRSLALLSRFPIVGRHSQQRLPYRMGRETFFMQRGILDVTVEIEAGSEVRFVGAHLKSKRAVAEADEALMRRNEAHLLRRHLDAIFAEQPDSKVVCYGDFNEARNQPAISEIIGSRSGPGYMSEVALRDDNGLVWTHFWDAADVYSRFDYFFVSRALRPHVDNKDAYIFSPPDFAEASDHRPIVMTLKLKKGGSTAAAQ